MKKTLLTVALAVAAMAPAVSEAAVVKVKNFGTETSLKPNAATEQLVLTNAVGAYYFPDGEIGNYYLVLSDVADARYESSSGEVKVKNGFAVALDLYASPSTPVELPSGTFELTDTYTVFTCTSEYSIINKYDADGQLIGESGNLTSDVLVSDDGSGIYTITAEMLYNGTVYEISYTGRLPFENSSETPTVFPQVKHDMDIQATGALAIYNGDMYQNNTGQMYVNLFDCAFENESGIMLEDGYCLSLCLLEKKFNNSKQATVTPGTYECARNLQRGTYYPGMEIDYMGMTIPFGTYVKHKDATLYGEDYGYGYITEGTIVVERADAGFRITVDCKTNLGYTLKATFEGEIPVIDNSDPNDTPPVHISSLEDDVDLDLSQHPVARIYNTGNKYGCQQFLVEIGSVSGADGVYEGDIMRLEFLCEDGTKYLPEGTYTLMDYDHNYYNMYAPGRMIQGYLWAGDMASTFYERFAPDRYLVLQDLAPIISGNVGVTQVDDTNWRFDIDVYDDLNYRISGVWTGPISLMYSPDLIAGIDGVIADGSDKVAVEYIDANTIRVVNADSSSSFEIYSVMGSRVCAGVVADAIDLSGLVPGVYVLNVNNNAIKIVKK